MKTSAKSAARAMDLGTDVYSSLDSEHIVIEDELSSDDSSPVTVTEKRVIPNRLARSVTELTLYQEGFVEFRERMERKPSQTQLIEVRFLDPSFNTKRQFSKGWLTLLLVSTSVVGVAVYLLPSLGLDIYRLQIAAAAVLLALVGLYGFLIKSREMHTFSSSTGRAEVLKLKASLGSLLQTRGAARAIAKSIRAHRSDDQAMSQRELREEMKAHYRMADAGVISKQECSDSAARILARFD